MTSANWTTYLSKQDGIGGALSQINGDLATLNSKFTQRIQHGESNYSGLKQGGYSGKATVTVTLPYEMPDANYFAHAELTAGWTDFPFIVCYAFNKTKTTFDVVLIDSHEGSAEVPGQFRWVAIKSMA